MKTLSLSTEQLKKIRELQANAQTVQDKITVYLGAVLDQHDLKGIWNVVGITDKGIQVEKK